MTTVTRAGASQPGIGGIGGIAGTGQVVTVQEDQRPHDPARNAGIGFPNVTGQLEAGLDLGESIVPVPAYSLSRMEPRTFIGPREGLMVRRRAFTLSDLGAGERIRTAGLPFTTGPQWTLCLHG